MKPLQAGLDQLDLAIIAKLRRNALITNKAIATELEVSESTIGTRIRNLSDRNIMRVVAAHDVRALGCELLTHFLIEVVGRDPRQVAEKLAATDRYDMVAICAGSPQLIVQVNARDRFDLVDAIRGLECAEGIANFQSTISLRILKFQSEYSASLDVKESAEPKGGDILTQILAIVERDGRIGNREIGRMLGVSEALVRKRLKALTDKGAIKFTAMVDPRAIGLNCSAVVRLSVRPDAISEVGCALVGLEEISFASVSAGGNSMLTVVTVADYEALTDLVNSKLAPLNGVGRIEVSVIADVLKTRFNVVRIAPQPFY